jgi:hypothetical protein
MSFRRALNSVFDPEQTSGPTNLGHFLVAAGTQSARLHSAKGVVHMQRREFNTLLGVAATVRAKRPTALLREVGYVLLGLVSLATVTGLYFWLDVPLVAAAFTYLVALVLLSLVSNLSSLIVLSFIGACCLSYFFRSSDLQLISRRLPTRPHHNIRVCDYLIRRQLPGNESSRRTT